MKEDNEMDTGAGQSLQTGSLAPCGKWPEEPVLCLSPKPGPQWPDPLSLPCPALPGSKVLAAPFLVLPLAPHVDAGLYFKMEMICH